MRKLREKGGDFFKDSPTFLRPDTHDSGGMIAVFDVPAALLVEPDQEVDIKPFLL